MEQCEILSRLLPLPTIPILMTTGPFCEAGNNIHMIARSCFQEDFFFFLLAFVALKLLV